MSFTRLFNLSKNLSFQFLRAGHILGSGMVEMKSKDPSKSCFSVVIFGRPVQYITKKPDEVESADYLILESTYGNQKTQSVDMRQQIAEVIRTNSSSWRGFACTCIFDRTHTGIVIYFAHTGRSPRSSKTSSVDR